MQRIRELRAERGLTQVRLAVAADMNPATLNRIEQGKANPNLKTLERLAAALGVGLVDLLVDDSPKVQASLWPEEGSGRREEVYEPWAEYLNRLAERWEEKVARGDFDTSAVTELSFTLADLSPVLVRLATKEKLEQPKGYSDTFGPIMGAGINRIMDLINPLIETAYKKRAGGDNVIVLEEARRALSGSRNRAAV